MAISTLKGKNVDIQMWIHIDEVESAALDQLRNVATLPWIAHLVVMPDVHLGHGATVGSVIAMREAVSPAAVGVDIGCGMMALRTNLDVHQVDQKAKAIFDAISAAVPVGFTSHGALPALCGHEAAALLARFTDLTPEVAALADTAAKQLGTLGGGNHFIEVTADAGGRVWITLHSGSRRVGKEVAEIHITKAQALEHNAGLVDRQLAAFLANTPEMTAYRHDLYWAQEYARLNRETIAALVLGAVRESFPAMEVLESVACHHNYVAEEVHCGERLFVTRKGAINAEAGRLGIVPGAMGAKSYIVRGRGNVEALNSAPHGAGRRMSRGAAKRKFTVDDLLEATKATCCRKDVGVLDEIPGAYKSIDRVMSDANSLVEIVAELQPAIVCVKG